MKKIEEIVNKMPIYEKAYRVWHPNIMQDDLNYKDWKYWDKEDIPIVYTTSPSKAKALSTWLYDFNDWVGEYDEPITYINMRVERVKSKDIVLYNNKSYTRTQLINILEKEEKLLIKQTAINSYSDDTLFYVQRGYVGNSVLFWGINRNGYTCDIDKAHKFTKKEILDEFVPSYNSDDRIWESTHIESNIRKHVDGQYLNHNFKH